MYLLLQADQRLKQNHEDLPLLAHLEELYLFVKAYGLILNQELNRISLTQLAKRLTTLLRQCQIPQDEDGANEFWRLKGYLRNEFENSQHWSDEMWKSKMAKGGGNKKRFQYCTDPSGQEIIFFISELFKVIQDPIPLILHFRTVCSFRTISSAGAATLDGVIVPAGCDERDMLCDGMGTTLAWMVSCDVVPASSLTWRCLDHAWRVATYDVGAAMSDVASSLAWCSIGIVDGDRKLRMEAMVQQNPCTEKCDVGIPLRLLT